MSILIKNATIVNPITQGVIHNGVIEIYEDKISHVGKKPISKKFTVTIDAKNRVVIPGLICAHHHFYSLFAKGLVLRSSPKNFLQILKQLWWKLDKSLFYESIYLSSIITGIECIRNGTTTIFDHHESQNYQIFSLDAIKKAITKLGLRGCLCYGISDRYSKGEEGIEENQRVFEESEQNALIKYCIGIHASFTVTDATLKKISELKKNFNYGIHIHLDEDVVDSEISLQKHKLSSIERLKKFNLLDEKTILAHCVHLKKKYYKLVKNSNAFIIHNPQSNMNNGVGTANILDMISYGLNVGLGTDGMSSNMLQEGRIAFLLQKHNLHNPSIGFSEAGKILFQNNSILAERFFMQKFGQIKKKYNADVVITNYIPQTPINKNNFLGHLFFGVVNYGIDTLIINGKIIMKSGKILTCDEEVFYKEAQKVAQKVWKRFYKLG